MTTTKPVELSDEQLDLVSGGNFLVTGNGNQNTNANSPNTQAASNKGLLDPIHGAYVGSGVAPV
jgi:hypothetical protein